MPRILALLLAFLLAVTPVFAHNWVHVVEAVEASLVSVTSPAPAVDPQTGEPTMGAYQCTGFVIDRTRGHIMTAAHCLHDEDASGLFADGQHVRIVYQSDLDDVLILATEIRKPALRPHLGFVRKGQEVLAMGYGFGVGDIIARPTHVANPRVKIGPQYPGDYLMATLPYVDGMSGGPVVDTSGRLVSLIQKSNPLAGVGRPIKDVYASTAVWWGPR